MKNFLALLLITFLPHIGYAIDLGGSTARPTGSAGGDLTGTYPSPTLAIDRVRITGDNMTGQLTTSSTITVQGNAFSVGGSTNTGGNFIVNSTGTYIKADASGIASPSGYVGELISGTLGSAQNAAPTTVLVAIATITLTAGVWDISGYPALNTGGTTAATSITGGISSSNTSMDANNENNRCDMSAAFSVSLGIGCRVGPRRVNISASTTYYLLGGLTYSTLGGAQWQTFSILRATRIR